MLTTYQRLAPEGMEWRKHMVKGQGVKQDKNPTTLWCMAHLLDRAVTFYWANRPDPRNRQTHEVPLPEEVAS